MKMRALILLASVVGSLGAAAPAWSKPAFNAPEGFRLEKDGTLLHQKSGTRFPLLFDGFARTANISYDPDGKNVAVVYKYAVGKQVVEARIALVQIMMMTAHEHYAALSPLVGKYFDDLHFTAIKPLGDGALTIEGLKPDQAWQGRFSALRQRTPYLLSLTTISRQHWDARVTAAYPAAIAPQAQERIVKLLADIKETSPLR